ncbi:hypothetical protein N7451_004071 [Penicillium sp. IBT 35674x]|nr:hypothetical protein N7451_004071 [Penicillium sp. IBT 35674x]
MDFVSVPRGERRLKSLPYAKLTSNNLVEPFNDCTLCLTEIDKRMNTKTGNLTGSPEVYSDITFRTMGFVLNMISMVNPSLALELDGQKDSLLSLKCTEAMRKTAEIAGESWYRNKGFKTIIIELLASQAFLDTAKAVESLLNDFVESGSTIA